MFINILFYFAKFEHGRIQGRVFIINTSLREDSENKEIDGESKQRGKILNLVGLWRTTIYNRM